MKYLLILALILGVVWLWRHNRQAEKDAAAPPRAPARPAATGITEIVACSVCQVHLPKSEALIGHEGKQFFCSEAHRREAGG